MSSIPSDQATDPQAVKSKPVSMPQPADTSGANPGIAADTDLIEDEWVEIAKRIIVENREDPYSLTNAMIMLKADYMKKRYGKDINANN